MLDSLNPTRHTLPVGILNDKSKLSTHSMPD